MSLHTDPFSLRPLLHALVESLPTVPTELEQRKLDDQHQAVLKTCDLDGNVIPQLTSLADVSPRLESAGGRM